MCARAARSMSGTKLRNSLNNSAQNAVAQACVGSACIAGSAVGRPVNHNPLVRLESAVGVGCPLLLRERVCDVYSAMDAEATASMNA